MKKPVLILLYAAIALSSAMTTTTSYAYENGQHHYAVTITNITHGQIMAPAAVIVHNRHYQLFTLGQAAIPELALLAEEGNPAELLSSAASMPSVYMTAAGSGPISPGASVTIEVNTAGRYSDISVAAMLVSTNDGFMSVRNIKVPANGGISLLANAYDAGSEANSESCDFVPGPPCGSHVHDNSPAEGYVYIHPGIHGIGGLDAATYDWRGPVAKVEIKRMY